MSEKKTESKKITIKQFEWYEVEAKVRELLTELLQPFIKKQTEQSIKINEIKRTLNLATQKLQDHDFLLTQQNARKPTYVQLQDDQIQALKAAHDRLSLTQGQQIRDMKKTLEIYEDKIKQLNQLEAKIQREAEQRIKQAQSHKQYVDSQVQLMLKRLDTQDSENNNFRATTRNTVTKLETKSVVLENRISELQTEMKRKTSDIIAINEDLTKIHEKNEGHRVRLDDLTFRVQERQKDQKLSEKFLGKTLQLSNELSFIRNYMTLYQPLYTQMQISETMHKFTKGVQKTRLCVYEQRIFAQIHHKILNLDGQSLEYRMAEYSDRIRKIINKNKKYVIKMKVKSTHKIGTNNYEIRQIDEKLLIENQEGNNSKPVPVIIPEQQVFKIVEQKWERLTRGFDEEVAQKTEPLKLWVHQLQEQSLLKAVETGNRIDQFEKNLHKNITDFSLHLSDFKSLSYYYEDKIDNLEKVTTRHTDSIKDLINFNSVVNHIIIQDEIDRQGLSLYALKSENSNGDRIFPHIKLDQKCVSCENHPSSTIINQAFKMACLAYNPSQIKIDDKKFSREEILQISTGILERLKHHQQVNSKHVRKGEGKLRSKSTLQKSQMTNASNKPESYQTIQLGSKKTDKQFNTLLPNLKNTNRKRFIEKGKGSDGSVFF